jgi:hypothetical protein
VLEPLGNLQIKCVEANVSHWKTWFESHSQHHDSKEASTLVAPQYKRRTKTPCCQPAHQPCNISLSVLEFSSMLYWKPLSSLGGDPNPHHRLLHISQMKPYMYHNSMCYPRYFNCQASLKNPYSLLSNLFFA